MGLPLREGPGGPGPGVSGGGCSEPPGWGGGKGWGNRVGAEVWQMG